MAPAINGTIAEAPAESITRPASHGRIIAPVLSPRNRIPVNRPFSWRDWLTQENAVGKIGAMKKPSAIGLIQSKAVLSGWINRMEIDSRLPTTAMGSTFFCGTFNATQIESSLPMVKESQKAEFM